VPHGRQEQHHPLTVAPDVPGFRERFDHQHLVQCRVAGAQGRSGQVQLVTEHEDQVAHVSSSLAEAKPLWPG